MQNQPPLPCTWATSLGAQPPLHPAQAHSSLDQAHPRPWRCHWFCASPTTEQGQSVTAFVPLPSPHRLLYMAKPHLDGSCPLGLMCERTDWTRKAAHKLLGWASECIGLLSSCPAQECDPSRDSPAAKLATLSNDMLLAALSCP